MLQHYLIYFSAIYRGLTFSRYIAWIGLTDKENEGVFRWVNGDQVSLDDQSFWESDQPSGGSGQNCCLARFNRSHPEIFDADCSWSQYGLCEKPI